MIWRGGAGVPLSSPRCSFRAPFRQNAFRLRWRKWPTLTQQHCKTNLNHSRLQWRLSTRRRHNLERSSRTSLSRLSCTRPLRVTQPRESNAQNLSGGVFTVVWVVDWQLSAHTAPGKETGYILNINFIYHLLWIQFWDTGFLAHGDGESMAFISLVNLVCTGYGLSQFKHHWKSLFNTSTTWKLFTQIKGQNQEEQLCKQIWK